MLVRREILILSKEKLTLKSQYYVEEISSWADSVLSEATIYKDMIEKLGLENEATYKLMSASTNVHEAYPYGLYMGDGCARRRTSQCWF